MDPEFEVDFWAELSRQKVALTVVSTAEAADVLIIGAEQAKDVNITPQFSVFGADQLRRRVRRGGEHEKCQAAVASNRFIALQLQLPELAVEFPVMKPLGIAGAAILFSATLSAQWPLHPVGVPKGPDGKPDLSAPPPRTPDGKPDLSGIWYPQGGRGFATLGNVAGGIPGGLPFQPWAAELQRKRAAADGWDNPDGLCKPQGPLQDHTDPQPRKIVQTPTQIIMIFESNYGLRTIYMDGRKLPPQGEPQPFWHGYSVGRWEGDTLVVDSNNFHDDGWLDARGSPYTEALTLTERIRRVNYGQLDIEVTIDDPKAYTKPFTVRINQQIAADGQELIEFICHENQMFLKLTGRERR